MRLACQPKRLARTLSPPTRSLPRHSRSPSSLQSASCAACASSTRCSTGPWRGPPGLARCSRECWRRPPPTPLWRSRTDCMCTACAPHVHRSAPQCTACAPHVHCTATASVYAQVRSVARACIVQYQSAFPTRANVVDLRLDSPTRKLMRQARHPLKAHVLLSHPAAQTVQPCLPSTLGRSRRQRRRTGTWQWRGAPRRRPLALLQRRRPRALHRRSRRWRRRARSGPARGLLDPPSSSARAWCRSRWPPRPSSPSSHTPAARQSELRLPAIRPTHGPRPSGWSTRWSTRWRHPLRRSVPRRAPTLT